MEKNVQPRLNRPLRALALFGLLAICVIMVANAIARYRSSQQVLRANRWVEHTLAVNVQLQSVGSLLRDAETGQRGFLLTGNQDYLKPYQTAVEQLPTALQQLRGMVSDNTTQVGNLQQLDELSSRKLSELRRTIDLYRSGQPDAARSVVLSNFGENDMDQIRAVLENMAKSEADLLSQRKQALRDVEFRENVSLAAGLITSVLALIAFAWALTRLEIVRERSRVALMESEEWLSTTLSSIGDCVIATDREGNVRFLNPIAQQVTQFSQQAAEGRSLREVFPIYNEVTREPAANPVDKVISTGMVVGLANHTVLVRPDGSEVAIDDSAAPILDRQGNVSGVVLVFRDVSHQRDIEKAMRISEKLAAAGKLAATVAHEINNPLEAASNLLYLMRDEELSPDGRTYLSMAEQQLMRVSHIARQTLAFYRDPRQPEALDLGAVCGRIVELYRPRFTNRNVQVSTEYQPGVAIFGTEGEIAQVISNLVSNALDAVGNNGAVAVKVAREEDGSAFVSVSDSGSGILQENLTRIFEPFFTTKKDVGTGLGLWVSKEIVEKLGGTIKASSAGKGQGATFSVIFPFYVQERSSIPVSATTHHTGDAG